MKWEAPCYFLETVKTVSALDSDIFKSAVCKIRRMRIGSRSKGLVQDFSKLKLRMHFDFVGLSLKCAAKTNVKSW